MRRRILWLMPDLASARRAMHDLVQARVDVAHIHFAASEGTDLAGLRAANLWQTSDLIPAAKTGWVVGSACGMVIGLVVGLSFPVLGEEPEWELAVVLGLLGGVVGAWSASMVGISIPSPCLRRFEGAMAQGWILLMVDLPRARSQDVEALLRAAHPKALFEGDAQQVPAFR
ncbi:MAG: DUF1269 domain-containing protein [Variovorax sp.]|nr:DUF1269 domain-containing protein [Variovorax sp.]